MGSFLFRKYTSSTIFSVSTSSLPKIFLLKANPQRFVLSGMLGVSVCILNFAIFRWCPLWRLSGVTSSCPLLLCGKEEAPQSVSNENRHSFKTVFILDCSNFCAAVNAHVLGSV